MNVLSNGSAREDNAPYEKSMKTMVKLNELSFKLLSHLPYFPDLAPSDYWLFADLKRMLQRKRFGSNEEEIAETEAYFEMKDESFYKKGIKKLEKRRNECITLKETMLMNEVKFLGKTVFLLVRPETY